MHERRGGDVRSGGKGTKVDAGGTITDGKGTTVSTTERAGPPAPRPETRGEFRVARGRETGNKKNKTNEEREKSRTRKRTMTSQACIFDGTARTLFYSKYDVTRERKSKNMTSHGHDA